MHARQCVNHVPTPAARVLDALFHLSHDVKSVHTVHEGLGLVSFDFCFL